VLPSPSELELIVASPRVTVFSAFRNAGIYAGWSLRSVLEQDFPSWQAVVVDDASDDSSWKELDRVMPRDDPRVWAFRRSERHRKLDNFLTYWPIIRGEIIVEMDGDDWFSRTDALSLIVAQYDADKRVEATAGGHHGWPSGATMLPCTQPASGFRIMQGGFALTVPAPRTWKRVLTERSLVDEPEIYVDPTTGEPWETNADLAMFGPALLHAEHIASINEVLVEVSTQGVAHDHAENLAKQREEGMRLFEFLYQREWRANEALLRPFRVDQSEATP